MTVACYRPPIKPRTVATATFPRVEPITLAEAKQHLRIYPEYAEDDAYVQGLIAAAVRLAESRLGITWAVRQYRVRVCGCVSGSCGCGCNEAGIELPHPPVLVDADHPVVVETPDGVLDTDAFTVDADRWPAILTPTRGWRGPATITYWAGVPSCRPAFQMARTGCLQLIANWYRNRESVTPDVLTVVPHAVDHLFAAESYTGRF